MSPAIIHLENIHKAYYMGKQAIPVLKGISLEIFKNEYVALMGPSGSGKSTVLRAFEDMGFYCVDNLPVELIPIFAELHSAGRAGLPVPTWPREGSNSGNRYGKGYRAGPV